MGLWVRVADVSDSAAVHRMFDDVARRHGRLDVALKIMGPKHSGSIINMASIMGTSSGIAGSHYCAAKAGILGLTRALAREVVTRNIRADSIAPGWIDTPMTAPLGGLRPLIEMQTPMGHLGDADDVAWAAIYLASAGAKFVTGQVLSPNGGWHMSQ